MTEGTNSLDSLFNPRSVAIAGASPGKPGQLFLDSILASGYKGLIYAINSKGQEVSGLKAYTSINDLPEPVDYVVCCIPATRCRSSSGSAEPRKFTSGLPVRL